MKQIIFIGLLLIFLGTIAIILIVRNSSSSRGVNDFESCAKKYPVMETYPEQCRTPDGKTYVQSVQ